MESIHGPKKPGAARAGVLAAFPLLALLLALPCAWYAVYRDQMMASIAGSVRFGAALPSRPSGVIIMGPPRPGRTRKVQIQHTGGQVITTIITQRATLMMRAPDPHPPSNPLDSFGQILCDRYNAWKCERGDPQQPPGMIHVPGGVSISGHMNPQPGMPAGPTLFIPSISTPIYVPGTRAPGSFPPPAARRPARP